MNLEQFLPLEITDEEQTLRRFIAKYHPTFETSMAAIYLEELSKMRQKDFSEFAGSLYEKQFGGSDIMVELEYQKTLLTLLAETIENGTHNISRD